MNNLDDVIKNAYTARQTPPPELTNKIAEAADHCGTIRRTRWLILGSMLMAALFSVSIFILAGQTALFVASLVSLLMVVFGGIVAVVLLPMLLAEEMGGHK